MAVARQETVIGPNRVLSGESRYPLTRAARKPSVTKDCKEWQIDRLKCCACNLCVEICPVKCLSMQNQYAPVTTDRAQGIFIVKLEDATGGT